MRTNQEWAQINKRNQERIDRIWREYARIIEQHYPNSPAR